MRLEGLHHITMITGHAQPTVDFYADLLGLRLVKKTVNFDQPDAYHLYFGDELGTPGSILTWFEFAGAAPGRPGPGTIHTLSLAVGAPQTLDFWAERLAAAGHSAARAGDKLVFADPDGLRLELTADPGRRPGPAAVHPDVPPEYAIGSPAGARAYARAQDDRLLIDTLGFARLGPGEYRLGEGERSFHWGYDDPPPGPGRPGAGSVHHIAWASADHDHLEWRRRLAGAAIPVTQVIDRDYFRSIYFREPRGVLFEIATLSPGFAVDEEPDRLGESLRLPARHEHLRGQVERTLSPVVNPRTPRRRAAVSS